MRYKGKMSINLRGYLTNFDSPKVMGILNVTPDSFFPESRLTREEEIKRRVIKMLEEGADIIDVGGCSTRPGFSLPSIEEEWERVDLGCKIIKNISPDVPLSVDTFRMEIASRCYEKWKVDIINDISGGACEDLYKLVAKHHLIYILTHNREEGKETYKDVTAEVISELSWKLHRLHMIGVNDIIIDPGFGFSKNIDQNFQLLNELEEIVKMGYPVMIGISRKSMIYKTLGVGPEDSLIGTVALNAIALEKGANILRVHDIKEAKTTIELFNKLKNH